MKIIITETQFRKLINEDLLYYQEKYPEIFDKLNNLTDEELKIKLERLNSMNSYYLSKEQQNELIHNIVTAEKILDDRKNKNFDLILNKIKNDVFLGHKIKEIIFPDLSEDGKHYTFYIILDDESEFEYDTYFMKFSYFDQNQNYYTQDINELVSPQEAILNTNELKILKNIVRLNNMTFTKKPIPPNTTITKDNIIPQPPQVEEEDFQWSIGKGNDDKKISKISLHKIIVLNKLKSIALFINVGEEFKTENYDYLVSYNNFFKPEKEELIHSYLFGKEKIKINDYIDSKIYDVMIKLILQLNPKSKLAKKIKPINYSI